MNKKSINLSGSGKLILTILLVFLSYTSWAQQTITGLVTDATTKLPLIGATVLVKGTSTGTISDVAGKYSIKVSGPSDVLVFSYIGYESLEFTIGTQSSINVSLSEAIKAIDELVVIGYGTVKKSDLTGSVAVVSSADLNKIPTSTFDRALQGKAPGVMVTQTSGKPGEGISILVRGMGSINSDVRPIYIIDGMRTGSLNSINPADIESISILKDASASAIYGADGANGVVIINTKRGKSGATKVSFSAFTSFNVTPKKLAVMNADQYSKFYNELNKTAGITQPAYSDSIRQAYYGAGWQNGTDWQDQITQKAMAQNYNISVSGGGDNSNYSISANYYDESGILKKTGATRYTLRANSDFKIGDYVKVGESVNISRQLFQNSSPPNGNSWEVSTIASPLMAIFNPANKGGYAGPDDDFIYNGNNYKNTGLNDKSNPLAELEIPDHRTYADNVLASIYVEIQPVKWLTFKVTPSIDLTNGRSNDWLPSYTSGVRSNNSATLNENYYSNLGYELQNQLTFNKTFGEQTITVTAIADISGFNGTYISGQGQGFNYEQLNVLGQSDEAGRLLNGGQADPTRSLSYLARLIYDLKGKYLLTASIRRDGTSYFGEKNLFGNFPSVSLAWKLNEDLFQDVKEINMMKLRVGWGKTGNSRIGSFKYLNYIDQTTNFAPVFGNPSTLVPGTEIFYSFGNPAIKWEAANMLNIGTDVAVFNNKIQFSAEYYLKNQNDLLVQRPVSQIFGRSGDGSSPWVNLAKLQNRGFEFSLQYKQMEGAFTYSVGGTLTTIKNEVKSLPVPSQGVGNTQTIVGRSIGELYGYVADRIITSADYDTSGHYKYAMPAEGQPFPGDIKFKDLNHDGKIDASDRTMIGKSIPSYLYSFNFDCAFKGFDFSIFLNGMQDFQIYNQQRADLMTVNSQDRDHNKLVEWTNNYYTDANPSTSYVSANLNSKNLNGRLSTWWVENGSFLRVKDIQLGYSLTAQALKTIGLSRLRIYFSAANVAIFTKYKGRDPEGAAASSVNGALGGGTDNGTYPIPKSYTFGIQADF